MKATNTLSEVLICTFLIVGTVGIGTTVFQSGEKDLQASTVRNLKKVGLASTIYSLDNEGLYPMAMSYNTITRIWRTNTLVRTPAGWSGGPASLEPRRTEESRSWSNVIMPYGTNRTSYQVAGGRALALVPISAKTAEPAPMGINMNGLAHTYSDSAVASPSWFPAYWTGHGSNNIVGGAIQTPMLYCPLADIPCLYKPKQRPQGAFGQNGFFFLQCIPLSPKPSSRAHGLYAFYITQDGSVKSWPMGLVSKPLDTNPSEDPFSQYNPGAICPDSHWMDGYYPWLFRPDYDPLAP